MTWYFEIYLKNIPQDLQTSAVALYNLARKNTAYNSMNSLKWMTIIRRSLTVMKVIISCKVLTIFRISIFRKIQQNYY